MIMMDINGITIQSQTCIIGEVIITEGCISINKEKNTYYVPLISPLPSQIISSSDINHSYITIIPKYDLYHLINLHFNTCSDICDIIDNYVRDRNHYLPNGEAGGQIKKIRCEDTKSHFISGNIDECFKLKLCNEKIKLMWNDSKLKWVTLYRRCLF